MIELVLLLKPACGLDYRLVVIAISITSLLLVLLVLLALLALPMLL